jgi:RNA polymerase sigma factor (sigma-70 family)
VSPTPPDRRPDDHHHRDVDTLSLAELVEGARTGCPGAWRAVVARFDVGLHALARGYGLDAATVDDAVQQTWLAAVTHLAALRDPAALPGWLRSILRRECLRAANRARREVPVVEHSLGDPGPATEATFRTATAPAPEDEVIRRTQLAELRAAVRRLSAREQELMTLLTDAREHTYTEIAHTLGLPVGSIGPTRARCIAKLRPLLAG